MISHYDECFDAIFRLAAHMEARLRRKGAMGKSTYGLDIDSRPGVQYGPHVLLQGRRDPVREQESMGLLCGGAAAVEIQAQIVWLEFFVGQEGPRIDKVMRSPPPPHPNGKFLRSTTCLAFASGFSQPFIIVIKRLEIREKCRASSSGIFTFPVKFFISILKIFQH